MVHMKTNAPHFSPASGRWLVQDVPRLHPIVAGIGSSLHYNSSSFKHI